MEKQHVPIPFSTVLIPPTYMCTPGLSPLAQITHFANLSFRCLAIPYRTEAEDDAHARRIKEQQGRTATDPITNNVVFRMAPVESLSPLQRKENNTLRQPIFKSNQENGTVTSPLLLLFPLIFATEKSRWIFSLATTKKDQNALVPSMLLCYVELAGWSHGMREATSSSRMLHVILLPAPGVLAIGIVHKVSKRQHKDKSATKRVKVQYNPYCWRCNLYCVSLLFCFHLFVFPSLLYFLFEILY